MCGTPIEKGYLIEVEGARLTVCERCAERGTVISSVKRKEGSRKETYANLVIGFGERIREGRKRKGYSLEELSKLVSIPPKVLKGMEEERIYPTIEQARKLEEVLEISIVEEEEYVPHKNDFTLTLGDVVRVR